MLHHYLISSVPFGWMLIQNTGNPSKVRLGDGRIARQQLQLTGVVLLDRHTVAKPVEPGVSSTHGLVEIRKYRGISLSILSPVIALQILRIQIVGVPLVLLSR